MSQSAQSNMLRNGLILACFAIVTTGLIALTFFGTKEQIQRQQQQKLLAILNAVIDEQSYDNDVQFDCALVTDPSLLGDTEPHKIYRATNQDKAVAVAVETTAPDGYSGKIHLVVGMYSTSPESAVVSGVRILQHKETPGLGDKIELRITDWVLDFEQQKYTPDLHNLWAVKKDGGKFDQFTGATITPRAVVSAVRKSIEYYLANQQSIFTADNACQLDSANQASQINE